MSIYYQCKTQLRAGWWSALVVSQHYNLPRSDEQRVTVSVEILEVVYRRVVARKDVHIGVSY